MSILTFFFLALIPYAASNINFNFPNISQNISQYITISGNATSISDDGIQDNSVITSGGYIGLPLNSTTNSNIYPFVAVEFDTYGSNDWDPKDPDTDKFIDEHVGININSITSVAYKKWFTNIRNGAECKALIDYYADSKTLSVSFTSFQNNSTVWETGLNHTIDLRDVLPERVIFGFSASIGDRYERNNVRSWSFNSTEVNSTDQSDIKPLTKRSKNNTLPKMGLIAGTLALVTVFAILGYFLWRKKNHGDKVDELEVASEMNNEFEMGASMPRRFSYHELARSTGDFADTNKLGEGGFGGVYEACGRKPIDPHVEERKRKLVEWVWDLYGTGTLLEAADSRLGSNFVEVEITCLMIVGLWCAHPDSKQRPSMKQALQVLNSEASLPTLPSKMPYVTYSELPTSSYGGTLSSGSNKHSANLLTSSTATS
ncbi:hypothetical protein L1987_55188 [Smallanthus sonchifolius]|uniref:Uncharacterized protein n=1 Tax=Smallanthus sonchifolius TaxID=185202 RepID=A0ACB9E9K7_9ASTR|nr:hypothetical protein L1987_55188 [Smallanthus sonchifolius]